MNWSTSKYKSLMTLHHFVFFVFVFLLFFFVAFPFLLWIQTVVSFPTPEYCTEKSGWQQIFTAFYYIRNWRSIWKMNTRSTIKHTKFWFNSLFRRDVRAHVRVYIKRKLATKLIETMRSHGNPFDFCVINFVLFGF